MVKCSRCRQRKAKRRCPGLRSDLCPLCCGIMRGREVSCPPACRFLAEHKPYREKKILEKKPPQPARPGRPPDDPWKDERTAWLALNIEAPLKEIGERDPAFTDGEAILALEYAKDKLSRGRNLILLPGEERTSRNDAGETVFRSLQNCTYEGGLILAAAGNGYKSEEKFQCLDRLILEARSWTMKNFQGRAYLEHLAEQFARIAESSRRSKIIQPE